MERKGLGLLGDTLHLSTKLDNVPRGPVAREHIVTRRFFAPPMEKVHQIIRERKRVRLPVLGLPDSHRSRDQINVGPAKFGRLLFSESREHKH
jgi:hypothetical protein